MGVFRQFARAIGNQPQSILAASLWVLVFSAIPAVAVGVDPDAIVLTSRVFDIPFQMDGDTKATLVRLYVSTDRGKTWVTAAQQPLPIKQFHFEATADGEYWFTHATDLDTIANPATERSPERKIFIDSVGPSIELIAGADVNGTLSAQLTLDDPHKVATLRVLYATDVVQQWTTVANSSIDAKGRFTIRPDVDWRQISVHVTATDSIGNASVQAKSFRRPRLAATQRPRLVGIENAPVPALEEDSIAPRVTTQTPNQLRVRTVAGPSDPPNFRLGPTPNAATRQQAAPPSTAPLTSSQNVALQSPGAGPLQSTHQSTKLRSTSPTQDTRATGRSLQTFGSAFGAMAGTRASASTATAPQQEKTPDPIAPRSQTLPSYGLTAKLTPDGIEVLPAPAAERDIEPETPATTSELLRTPPPEKLPAPGLSSTPPKSPNDPITESIPLPLPDADQVTKPTRPRTIEEAMRPIAPTSEADTIQKSTKPSTETIPTPAPSSTPDDERRNRVERAAQMSREQQQRYDRAQLARSVPFRWSNSNRFSLEYELEAVGASGVEAVELYGSIDAGRSWKRWGADPDRTSPFDIETKGEGVFSFRIVVLGNNGLSSPRPLPGDQPDIAVIVDETLPSIKITSARYGEGDRTGSLVIRYECSDENLMNRPVAIAFGETLEGPWTTIAAGLRNDGLYVWPADPKLPPAIYLRVDAADQAGNTGSYLLDQPIATGGLAPRARILGFRSR